MRLTGTLETIDGRRALRFERRLPHAPARVWRAVTDPDEMGRWFVATPPWTPVADETFSAAGQDGRITELEEPRALAWEWGAERYRFDLSPDGEGCRLVFLHFFDESYGPGGQHASGWEAYLSRLDAWLEGRELSEADAHRIVPELSERYARAFGESAAPARESFARHGPLPVALDGDSLVIEWRFGYPVERVWRAVAEERSAWFPSDAEVVVLESDEPRLLVAAFWGQPIRFELRADGDGCVLRFTHEIPGRDESARTAAGWDRCLVRLHALLGGSPVSEGESLSLWPVVHERYAEAFGVDPELGRQAYESHPAT